MRAHPEDLNGLSPSRLIDLVVRLLEQTAALERTNAEQREESARLKGLKVRPNVRAAWTNPSNRPGRACKGRACKGRACKESAQVVARSGPRSTKPAACCARDCKHRPGYRRIGSGSKASAALTPAHEHFRRLGTRATKLLMMRERPEITLHTNCSENDIRCQVTRPQGQRRDARRSGAGLPRCLSGPRQDGRRGTAWHSGTISAGRLEVPRHTVTV